MHRFAIVEDNKEYALVLGWKLEGEPSLFTEVSQFVDTGFEVVFCDLRLKETYGAETVKKLREKTTAPIIVLTGLGHGTLAFSEMKDFIDAGADEVFPKEVISDPTFPEQVDAIIAKHKAAKNEQG